MIGFDPNPARRPGLPVPTRRETRVVASANTGGAGSQDRNPSARPDPRPASSQANAAAHRTAETPIAAASARAGVVLQADLPAPRRGLRADAGERARYRAAYESAGRAPAPRPTLVRSA